jgi:hypothetical protein
MFCRVIKRVQYANAQVDMPENFKKSYASDMSRTRSLLEPREFAKLIDGDPIRDLCRARRAKL